MRMHIDTSTFSVRKDRKMQGLKVRKIEWTHEIFSQFHGTDRDTNIKHDSETSHRSSITKYRIIVPLQLLSRHETYHL